MNIIKGFRVENHTIHVVFVDDTSMWVLKCDNLIDAICKAERLNSVLEGTAYDLLNVLRLIVQMKLEK